MNHQRAGLAFVHRRGVKFDRNECEFHEIDANDEEIAFATRCRKMHSDKKTLSVHQISFAYQ